jgi:hypothetical protein
LHPENDRQYAHVHALGPLIGKLDLRRHKRLDPDKIHGQQSGIPIELAGVWTAGSMTHIDAPIFVIVEDEWFITPANIDVMNIIRNAANVTPISKAVNFALSLTSSL